MALNNDEIEFYKKLVAKSQGAITKPLKEITLEESRRSVNDLIWLAGKEEAIPYIDILAQARDNYEIPVRIYNSHLDNHAPLFVYFMGNAYLYDLFKVNAIICSRIAKNSRSKIILVNTRLAPENPLPKPIYDAYDALKWLVLHHKALSLNCDAITLGGYSSGAACALAVASMAFRKISIKNLILLNGLYDLTFSSQAYYEAEKEDYSINEEFFNFIIENQRIDKDKYKDPMYSPVFYKDFQFASKIILLVAEHDRLRSQTELFFERLIQLKVKVEKVILPGQTHNTILYYDVYKKSNDPAKTMGLIIDGLSNHASHF